MCGYCCKALQIKKGNPGKGSLSAGAGAGERVVPADALLLAGTCIVEEAVLTGESTPQWKNPIGASADARASDEGLDIAEVRCKA